MELFPRHLVMAAIALATREDVKDIMDLLTEVSSNWSQAIEKRQQTEDHLQAVINSNADCLQKLRSLTEKGQLSTTIKGSAISIKKNLEEVLLKSKLEVIDDSKVLSNLTSGKVITKSTIFNVSLSQQNLLNILISFIFNRLSIWTTREKTRVSRQRRENWKLSAVEMVAMENCYQFPSNKISVEQLSSLQPLNCRDLNGQHSEQGVNVIEFSDDGSLFVSGGDDDGRVLLWPTNKAIDLKWKPQATEMETKHEDYIWCLALSTRITCASSVAVATPKS